MYYLHLEIFTSLCDMNFLNNWNLFSQHTFALHWNLLSEQKPTETKILFWKKYQIIKEEVVIFKNIHFYLTMKTEWEHIDTNWVTVLNVKKISCRYCSICNRKSSANAKGFFFVDFVHFSLFPNEILTITYENNWHNIVHSCKPVKLYLLKVILTWYQDK